MYCDYLNGGCCYGGTSCTSCVHYLNYWKNINESSPVSFNYECPDCHGKFNMPIYKYFSIPISRTDRNLSSIGYYSWVCPFCERKMEGLS